MDTTGFHQLMLGYYLKPVTAQDAADSLNAKLKTTFFTRAKVEAAWSDEYESSFILQQLGERPPHGFPPSGKLTLAEMIMVAA